jgi:hypothetical protein
MNHAKERLDFDGLNERVSKHPEAKAIEQELNRIESRITKINTQSRIIRSNPSIPSEQKEQSLKVLRDSKNQLAEQAVKFGNQFGYD